MKFSSYANQVCCCCSGELECKGNKVFYPKTFRSKLKYRVRNEFCKLIFVPAFSVCLSSDQRFERVAQSLASLIESGLYDGLEQGFVTSEFGALIPYKSYYGGFHFRWRIEAPSPTVKRYSMSYHA